MAAVLERSTAVGTPSGAPEWGPGAGGSGGEFLIENLTRGPPCAPRPDRPESQVSWVETGCLWYPQLGGRDRWGALERAGAPVLVTGTESAPLLCVPGVQAFQWALGVLKRKYTFFVVNSRPVPALRQAPSG